MADGGEGKSTQQLHHHHCAGERGHGGRAAPDGGFRRRVPNGNIRLNAPSVTARALPFALQRQLRTPGNVEGAY